MAQYGIYICHIVNKYMAWYCICICMLINSLNIAELEMYISQTPIHCPKPIAVVFNLIIFR